MESRVERLPSGAYVVGGLSFIPLFGVIFGVLAILWGLLTRKRGRGWLVLLGALGIGTSCLLYGSLYYFGFVQRGGIYDMLRDKLAQSSLVGLVQTLEFYRIEHGNYPESLESLQKSLPEGALFLGTDPHAMINGAGSMYFYYDRVDPGHYYLRSVGTDGEPFTADDILPLISPTAAGKIGLLLGAPTKK